MKIRLALPVVFLLAGTLTTCSIHDEKTKSTVVWTIEIPAIGSQSSPRTADLNKDGTLDVVIGAGKNEFQSSDMGILAFDGKSGEMLWKDSSRDQIYGSATFYDVTGDTIKDIFIGGRTPQLKAINGSSGKVIWKYDFEQYSDDPILRYARFNFNNSVMVPDQNKDGLDDLLTINGGNAFAEPNSTVNRFPAVLMLFDSKTGKVIAADTMPDGKESYMTPLFFKQPGSKELNILYGTGGETINGNLYIASIPQLLSRKLSESKIIAEDTGHGFIAPPTLADITADGILDFVAISHGSKVVAINGKDHHVIWTKKFPGTESSNSFAAGYFTNDDIPDFFTFISKGQWPNSTGSVQVMIDGKNGNVAFMDSIGCTGFSSPVVYDLNYDGIDEAIISVNEFDCSLGYALKNPDIVDNKLITIDFAKKVVDTIDYAKGFKNIFSTPWIGDLDKDGYLDMIYCQYYHHSNLLSFLGMRIRRIDLPVKMDKPVLWGAYLGPNGDGIFLPAVSK